MLTASERIVLSQNLKSAINSRRPALIKRALNEYKYLKPSQGDDLLVEGSRLLRKLEAQEGKTTDGCPQANDTVFC